LKKDFKPKINQLKEQKFKYDSLVKKVFKAYIYKIRIIEKKIEKVIKLE